MRPIAIVLIAIALAIAGLTAVLVNRFLADQTAKPVAVAQKTVETTSDEVLVVKAELTAGAVVKPDDLHYVLWPVADGNSRLVRRGSGEDPKAGFVGATARRRLMAGEPITFDAVFRQDEAGVLAGMLSPGMRAVSVPVMPASGVNGFILPNDRVDVLLNLDVRAASQAGDQAIRSGDIARFASEVVLNDVRVLAVDNLLAKPEGAAVSAKTVTLEVGARDAEALATAAKLGEISLVLRSLAAGETGEAPPAGYTGDLKVSRALQSFLGHAEVGPAAVAPPGAPVEVRVNRAGATSVQRFPN